MKSKNPKIQSMTMTTQRMIYTQRIVLTIALLVEISFDNPIYAGPIAPTSSIK